MRLLSKSKLMAFRQCPLRLWLEVRQPELREDSADTQASFTAGYQVGEVARQLYDPQGCGELVELDRNNFGAAFAHTRRLLEQRRPIFEAGFQGAGALAFADVLLPDGHGAGAGWRMVEVKSSTRMRDYHREDVALQAFVARASGLALRTVAVAHVDSGWTYPGGGDYRGLLKQEDLSEEALSRRGEVAEWIAQAQATVQQPDPPPTRPGAHCVAPYACGFQRHCQSQQPQARHPVHWLPWRGARLNQRLAEDGITDMADVPDDWLSERQLRVKSATLTGRTYFDAQATARELAQHGLPAYFLDFETIQFAVPRWRGTRPYQQLPFQFSVHRLTRGAGIGHCEFLDLSGDNPSLPLAQALVDACGRQGVVYAYNAGFERSCIHALAKRHPPLSAALMALAGRLVDLLPVARAHYYHPSQQGSWSIKAVLPALCPDLRYDALDGVQDGGGAQQAYLEAIAPDTRAARRAALRRQLLAYCRLDTWAMVRLWAAFTGAHLEGH
ncbi:DUF2779 domain-containing protein [Melaminivora suipulveris]|uniref:DUF2779 domain-containing protein n=1 Tax=Melaminivora suipulveris TaxID=2109913 RepID=A0A2R3Q809_9BURK|nr:DUF2779 domain-containing protein [Melaminivora suipulveris]AVO47899.1 DUF2779 domain-containing protein [Melaminivora suipulveris]